MSEPVSGQWVTPVVRLLRPLGRGGMGSVWLSHHKTLDTEVVVKFLASSLCTDEPSRQRFAREATAAAKVKSPHVVQTLDHGVTDEGIPFIVMEHLEGSDLGKVLRERGLSAVQVAAIVEQVARALDAAHRHGVIHRDVKPANIFLTDVGARDPFVKLLDFGVAKTSQNQPLTTSGELLGTPVYMSPEQITGEPLDARSDVWALGIVAFRCLTGKRPFNGDSVASVAYQIVHAPIPLPSSLRPDIPESVDAWFTQACNRNKHQRYGSARAMADALWAALDIARASDWSGETPAPRISSGTLADTVVEGRPSQPSVTGAHGSTAQQHYQAIPPHPSGAMELTGGSLRSAVSEVQPRSTGRLVTVALAAAIPIALAIGFGASTLVKDAREDSAPGADVGRSDVGSEAPPVGSPTEASATAPDDDDASSPSADGTGGASPDAEGSASASASAKPRAAPRTYRPARPRTPPKPRVDPNDLGF